MPTEGKWLSQFSSVVGVEKLGALSSSMVSKACVWRGIARLALISICGILAKADPDTRETPVSVENLILSEYKRTRYKAFVIFQAILKRDNKRRNSVGTTENEWKYLTQHSPCHRDEENLKELEEV